MKFDFRGVVSAMITPLKNKGRDVDIEALQEYCDFLISKGVQGLFVCGTTGEGPLLSLEERKIIAEVVVDKVKKRAKAIIHTGFITTQGTVDLSAHAQKIGADAAGVVLPYFHSLDDDAIVAHFIEILRAVPDLPFFIYNIPQCAVNNLSPRILMKVIEKTDNFVGVKTSNPDLFQLQEYLALLGPDKPVFFGCDRLDLAALALGASGIISGNGSAFPEPFIHLYQTFAKGDLQAARKQHVFNYRLAMILRDGAYPAVYKKCLVFRGIKAGDVRPPQRELSLEETVQLKAILREIGLIN